MAVRTEGLIPLLREMKGPLFRDVNRELRSHALEIATEMVPDIEAAVRASAAPQAQAMSETVRAHRDRVPCVVIGKINPKLSKFSRRGTRKDGKPRADIKGRRYQLAYGVVYGPLGGRRDTPAHENYYRIPRDSSGGALGRAMGPGGRVQEASQEAYLEAFEYLLVRHGFVGPRHEWSG